MTDIIIIGAGPAGLTAAIYALRYGLSVKVFDKGFYGGQVATTPEVENYPAIIRISGIDFSTSIYKQAIELGADIHFEGVDKVSIDGKIKSVTTASGTYKASSIIIANGAKRRKLGCNGEEKFIGKGVSYCATCDAAFFKNKDVVIVGGGNTALEDSLFLSNNCTKVSIIHRKDKLTGQKSLINPVKSKSNIDIFYNWEVEEINGEEVVSSVKLKNLKDNSTMNINTSAVFIAIGFEPDNHLFADSLLLDKIGYIIADESCTTNFEGVYVAGDCRTKLLRQIVTAAGDGAVAAYQASNYINISNI